MLDYDTDECDGIVPMPEEIVVYNACNEPCDMLVGPCACGGYHDVKGIRDLCKNKGIYCEALEKVLNKAVMSRRIEKAFGIMLRGK